MIPPWRPTDIGAGGGGGVPARSLWRLRELLPPRRAALLAGCVAFFDAHRTAFMSDTAPDTTPATERARANAPNAAGEALERESLKAALALHARSSRYPTVVASQETN